MKALRRAALALAALVSMTSAARANEWKMDPLSNQVTIIQEARESEELDTREFLCLALNIYHESRGESEAGQKAVAHVVLNRRNSGRFPTSICAVTFQRSQFSWTVRPVGSLVPRETASWEKSQRLALEVLNGQATDPTGGATSFRDRRLGWRGRGPRMVIGGHIFSR